MSLPWIRIYKDLPEHPKAANLAAALGNDMAWAHMVQLWFWTAKVRPDGDLSGLPDQMIAARAGWQGDAKKFVTAAASVGFLDGDEFSRSVHNWAFYQEKHANRREADKLAKREKRAQKKNPVLPTVLQTVATTVAGNVAGSVAQSIGTLEERREEEKRTEKNLALFAPAPSEATEEKAPRGRPPKDTPEIVVDRERWLTQARALVGLTPEQTPPSKQLCIRFAQQRKKRGMEQLLRSLEGLESDPWAKQQGLQPLLSDAVIEKGLAKWNKGAMTLHVGRVQHGVGPINLDEMYEEA